jgi:P-type Cu+ transporter
MEDTSQSDTDSKPDTVTDPVCGMKVEPDKAAGHHEHDGTTYHFCSEGCLDKFKEDPESYLDSEKRAAKKKAAPKDAMYTCPMHPEVRQKGPGDCPKCGMALEPETPGLGEEDDSELRDMRRRFWIGVVFTLPILIYTMGEMIPGVSFETILPHEYSLWFQFILATPVVLYCGAVFFKRAWNSIVHWNLNMFTLIGIGAGVAYVYSIVALFVPDFFPPAFRMEDGMVPVYFEAAAVIITLVLLGQVLELKARSRTSSALKSLLELAPKTARRINKDGSEEDVSLDDLNEGDRLRVRPGEKVPVDGHVEDGSQQRSTNPWSPASPCP